MAAARVEEDRGGLRFIDDIDGSQLADQEGISEESWRAASRTGPSHIQPSRSKAGGAPKGSWGTHNAVRRTRWPGMQTARSWRDG
jgi:hypothetical protein